MRPQNSIHSNNPERNTYLESFHSMLHSEKAVRLDDEIDFKACELKIKFTNFDQNFAKEDETEFTLLDPFNRPYSYLTVTTNLCRNNWISAKRNSKASRATCNILKPSSPLWSIMPYQVLKAAKRREWTVFKGCAICLRKMKQLSKNEKWEYADKSPACMNSMTTTIRWETKY